MMNLLFVYGSLLAESEHEMAIYLKKYVKVLGRGYVKGRLYKIAWYPGAINDETENNYKIWGTLLEISQPEQVFKVLDEYEGYSPKSLTSSLFIRKKAKAIIQGKIFETWFYAYNHDLEGFPFIESGDFLSV